MSTQNLNKHIHTGLMIVSYEVRATGASRVDTGSIGRRNGSGWSTVYLWLLFEMNKLFTVNARAPPAF